MNPRSPLAKVDSVALLTGKTISEIYAMTDGGDLIGGHYEWVWNVSAAHGKIRDLRWWSGEVFAPIRQQQLTLDRVIDFILPPKRREYPAGEVCQLLQIRPITLSELRVELNGALRANSGFYPRAGLVKFFSGQRWLGSAPVAVHKNLPANIRRGAKPLGSDVPAADAMPRIDGAATHSIASGGVFRTAQTFTFEKAGQ